MTLCPPYFHHTYCIEQIFGGNLAGNDLCIYKSITCVPNYKKPCLLLLLPLFYAKSMYMYNYIYSYSDETLFVSNKRK